VERSKVEKISFIRGWVGEEEGRGFGRERIC
jgi:hypothetical protein